jgi:hypothetical protein
LRRELIAKPTMNQVIPPRMVRLLHRQMGMWRSLYCADKEEAANQLEERLMPTIQQAYNLIRTEWEALTEYEQQHPDATTVGRAFEEIRQMRYELYTSHLM